MSIKKKNKNNKKVLKRLKIITFLCIFVLIIELLYVGYFFLFNRTESLYFDGVNSLVSNDNYYVTVGSNNDNDYFFEKAKISKYNKKMEKTFEKLYNVGYNSAFFGALLDEDSIVAVGSYERDKDDHEKAIRRALIVKYDSSGEIIFEKDFKILDNSRFTSIVMVDDGYLVTGQSIYQSTRVGGKSGGAILLKYNKDGELLWSKTYGSNKFAVFNDLLVVNNSIYTVGVNEENLGIICQYDMDGNFITYNDYKYTDEIGFSGIVSIDNHLYVSGANHMSVDDTDSLIVEYDYDCEYQNQVIYDNKGKARFNKMIVDDHNNLIVIGIVAENKKSNDKRADNFNYDGIIGKYSSSLEKISVVTYGDERDDFFTDINLIDGNYLVIGYSSYEDGSYLSKFIRYSDALKILGVE